MKPIVDYHLHTVLCGHATGSPEEYVRQAIKVGLREIGFADHAPLVSHRDPSITMDFDQLPEYHRLIEDVQRDFRDRITIRLGLEADFIPGFENQTQEIINGYHYDYIIGSVHFIKEWAFDNPQEINGWKNKDTDRIYVQYYEYLRCCAETRMFNIMAHVDLVKKFGHRPTKDMASEITKTAEVFKACGVAIEINTSGLRKPVKEIYPSLAALKIYCKAGVPITFGSDSHGPQEVGKDFDQAWELAKSAGYKTYVLFRGRRIDSEKKIG